MTDFSEKHQELLKTSMGQSCPFLTLAIGLPMNISQHSAQHF
jgi:hypothetical protein